ncbi:MAG TPA: FecR family protein [Acidobacteriaceae bacterium]|jgi:hypothetical protein
MKTIYAVLTLSAALSLGAAFAAAQSAAGTIPSSNQLPVSSQAPATPQSAAATSQNATPAPQSAPAAAAANDDSPESGASEVRIVRLSQVREGTLMDRGTGNGFEAAFPNLPVIQGSRLRTTAGMAEVEFEDTSTLRVTPDTEVDFTTLNRNADGTTNSTMTVVRGTVYVDLEKSKGNHFTLVSDSGAIVVPPGARIRLSLGYPTSHLAVFAGKVAFTSSSGAVTYVDKKQQIAIDPANLFAAQNASPIQEGPWDGWNNMQEDFHKRYARGSALSGSTNVSGLSDLNYYGSWVNDGGCGRIWRPYFASAAWDPYANGLWAWYPDYGYSWVSAYPWGWAPFHSGSWMQCGAGWGWQPGNSFGGLGGPRRHHEPRGPGEPGHPRPIRHPYPVRPPRGPFPGRPLLAVNQKPLSVSTLNPRTQSFQFRKDSAGAGIPREMFGNLHKYASEVEHGKPATIEMMRTGGGPEYGAPRGGAGSAEHQSGGWRPAGGSGNHNYGGGNNSSGTHSYGGNNNSGGHNYGGNNGGGNSGGHMSGGGSSGGGGGHSGSGGSGSGGGGGGGGHSGGGGGGGGGSASSGGSSSGGHH